MSKKLTEAVKITNEDITVLPDSEKYYLHLYTFKDSREWFAGSMGKNQTDIIEGIQDFHKGDAYKEHKIISFDLPSLHTQ